MENYSVSVELSALAGAQVQQSSQNGQAYLLIPIQQADLSVFNEKVYLTLSMWAKDKTDAYGKTHSIKQSHSKAFREQLPPNVTIPYIGSAKPINRGGSNNDKTAPASPYVAQPPVTPNDPFKPVF